jgi:predicted metal-dependent HD superfamily phosphohydrolase
MSTKNKTAKERVIESLIKNLRYLSPFEDWIPEHPLVVDYIQSMDEHHRVYHSWVHILQMLNELDHMPPGIVNEPVRLRAGILFHDVVCVPCATDNEGKSAVFSSRFFRGHNIAIINDLIMATDHEFPFVIFGDDRDVICDLDLMILGVDKDRFELYRINIAEEYRGYCTNQEFQDGTLKFFRKLLDQSESTGIFRTKYFRNRCYEERARDNIKRLVDSYK